MRTTRSKGHFRGAAAPNDWPSHSELLPLRHRHGGMPETGLSRPSANGRVQPDCGSDSSPKTCRSGALRGENSERAGKVGLWPDGDGRLLERLAPNRSVRSDPERQQSGVDFAYRSTRHRPQAGTGGGPVWSKSVDDLGSGAQPRLRHRPRLLPELRRRAEDHCRHPGTAGHREDPHAPGVASACTASGASPWPGPASGLTLPNRNRSGEATARVAGVGCVRGFPGPMDAAC
jgi:hypothetical protein